MPKRYKVLITGSSGMLGIDLSNELGGDYIVSGVDVTKSGKGRLARFYDGNITDRAGIAAIIARARPDVVVHCAAWTDVDGCELSRAKAFRVNAAGTRNVSMACGRAGAAMVYISTDFVFDGKKRTPYVETDRARPLGVYGLSKLEGEVAVGKVLDRYFILRTSWLYGANGKNFVDTIIAKSLTEPALKVVRDQKGSPTYTKDLAAAIHRLLDRATGAGPRRPAYGIYHVSNSGMVSWYGYARTILRLVGSRTPVRPISSRKLSRPARRPSMSVMDTVKFEKASGRAMRNWKTALKDYIRNERKRRGRHADRA